MNDPVFQSRNFSLEIKNFRMFEAPAKKFSEAILIMRAGPLELKTQVEVGLSLAAERLQDFFRDSESRHWGAFYGAMTPEDVIQRVQILSQISEDAEQICALQVASAMRRYQLSEILSGAVLDEQWVVVSDPRFEYFFMQRNTDVQYAKVSRKNVDAVIDQFVSWWGSTSDL